jgi:hypothetical protein
MLSEYLDHAINFERLVAQEDAPTLRAHFENQAPAYRELAAQRRQDTDRRRRARPRVI